MKKICLACLAILFIFNLPSCMLPASTEESIKEETEATRSTSTPPEIAETDSVVMVAFADPVLEALMRATIGKSSGALSLAEAQTVTRLDLSNEWQKYETSQDVIQQISGLENFTNLEYLDLSYHSISDISSLQGLHKLKFLSLAGNQLVDLSPLSELTGLRSLILSDCTAEDYSPLVNLSNLEVLVLDNSSISDLWALASLTNLKRLYLAKTSVEDWFVLSEIYPNLEQKDFILPSTLQELGFVMDNNSKQARFDSDEASVVINHSSWGMSEMEWDRDIIRISLYVDDQYKMSVGYYGDIDAYVVQIYTDGRMDVNYVYDAKTDNLNLGEEDRQRFAAIVGRALGSREGEDVLLAPVSLFEDVIRQVFNLSPDTLFALPFEPKSLKSLGFYPDKDNAVCLYEQQGDWDYNLEIHRPEWGGKDFDVRFFTPISDEYRIVATYHLDSNKIRVSADDNNQGGAAFYYFLDTKEHEDEWCSYENLSVEQYFIQAYNDPAIVDIYLHSVDLMTQYFIDRFGMTFQEMFALPGCE